MEKKACFKDKYAHILQMFPKILILAVVCKKKIYKKGENGYNKTTFLQ